MSEPKSGDLQVWWIPQIPMQPFTRQVADLAQAKLLLETLADYDLFQFENGIKPDYSNVGGLSVFEDGEWLDWYDDETGDDFRVWMEAKGGAPETPTFGGHTAAEVAGVCDILARSADGMTNSYSETATIARRARDAIRFLLGMPKEPSDE